MAEPYLKVDPADDEHVEAEHRVERAVRAASWARGRASLLTNLDAWLSNILGA
jgi:hypothetical protein